jgi:hypothetical protein
LCAYLASSILLNPVGDRYSLPLTIREPHSQPLTVNRQTLFTIDSPPRRAQCQITCQSRITEFESAGRHFDHHLRFATEAIRFSNVMNFVFSLLSGSGREDAAPIELVAIICGGPAIKKSTDSKLYFAKIIVNRVNENKT